MFTIEHEFEASVVTLIDEGPASLCEDVVISVTADHVLVEQYDAMADETRRIRLSLGQARDLGAALNLPEGSYRLSKT